MSKIGIRQLIGEYLNSKDEGNDRFRRLYRIATLQGVRKFNMDITGSFKTVLLSVPSNGEIPFPDDYLDYSMVGIVNHHGEAVPFKHNENLVDVKSAFLAAQGTVVNAPTAGFGLPMVFGGGFGVWGCWLNYCFSGSNYHLYGLGGGTPTVGEFDIDDNAKCIRIAPGFPYQEVLVEYLSNGYDCDCNDYKIHTFASDAFLAWLRWKDNIDKKGVSDAKIRSLKHEFGLEKKAAKLRMNPVKVKEMQNEFRKHIKLAARA